jgi:magnesium transporter
MVGAPLDANLNDPVTRHMRRDFTRLRTDQTVGAALASLREHPPQERIIYFYVVDQEDRLQGVVPTRRLLLSPPEQSLTEVMIKPVIAIPDGATVLDACEFFTLHRLLAFPVVDPERRVLGVVDVELYTNELGDLEKREGNQDLFQLIGVHLTAAQQASALASFRTRFPWLLCNIGGGILGALLAGLYEEELQKVVALAMFIPVVLALAESVSTQSVSLALETLHGQRPTWAALVSKARSEFLTGLLLGIASALVVAGAAFIWLRRMEVVFALLGGITAGVTGAAVFGLLLPYLLRLLRRDPQVAAGPIALALADLITLLIYLNLARWLLR